MKRTLVLGSAWTASAAAAVGLGFLAVSLVDAQASPGTVPLAATITQSSDDRSPASTAPSGTPGQKATVGGTVYASCAAGGPQLASAPASGWSVDDSPSAGQVEFRNGGQKVEVHVLCANGVPSFTVEGSGGDDRSGGGNRSGSDDSARSSAATSTAVRTTDDSTGRVGGGHGADDPAGDDSSGRSGGGHGADG